MDNTNTRSPLRKGIASQQKAPPIRAAVIAGLSKFFNVKKNKFHGKDVGWCNRKSVRLMYEDDNKTAEFGPSAHFYTEIGTAVHSLLAKALDSSGMLVAEEMRIPTMGLPIGGFVDAIIEVNGRLLAAEFKTCGALPSSPKPDHVAQIKLYCLSLGLEGMLFYVSRNVADFSGSILTAEFEVEFTDGERLLMAKNISLAEIGRRDGFLPPVPAGLSFSKCKFCQYKDECFETGQTILPEFYDIPKEKMTAAIAEATQMAETIIAGTAERKALFLEAAYAQKETRKTAT